MVRSVRQLMWFREWPQGSVLGPLLFLLCTSELFHAVGNYMVGYADNITTYAVIPRSLARSQAMESLNHVRQQSTDGICSST